MRIRWRGLELPSKLTCDRATLTDTYGKFYCEPFEPGFAVTIGNSLRRVLLSSLEGSAVTRVKIEGVAHEITTIPGVVEDVTDIILNIKSLVVKNTSDQPQTIYIRREERGIVRAADIITTESVHIINPEHIIATLTEDVRFNVEMTVENGRGYRTAEENAGKDREIGVIPLDASFSPVVRVRFSTEETRVGQRTNYERLILEIWTNGTITPQLAIVEAAKILRKHLNPFIEYTDLGPEVPAVEEHAEAPSGPFVDLELMRKLDMSTSEFGLDLRVCNTLESHGILTIRDLVAHTEDELLQIRNFGETTLKYVKDKLAEAGLHLGMKVPGARTS
jgi:DNA-directed RNA polymerase subunit alpha